MLQLPADDPAVIDQGFQILSDWAARLTLAGDEIDQERGVVIEEWRLRRGASQRIRDQQFPVLLQGSRYAERLPIGKKDILETFDHERLRGFYRKWYRPELMSVVVVGDLPIHEMEKRVREAFGDLPGRPGEVVRPTFDVPGHDEMLVSVVTDPEATSSSVSLYHLLPVDPLAVEGDYRRTMVESLFNNMLNQRLDELRQQADPPFLAAYSYKGGFIRATDVYVLGAQVKDGGAAAGLEAVLTEAERVRRFGFTESEFQRTKKELKRWKQRTFAERKNTESRVYAGAYVGDFVRDEVSPGIEEELVLYDRYLDGIPLEEVNLLASELMTPDNRVLLSSGPEKDGVAVPTADDLRAVFARVTEGSLTAYEDDAKGLPLLGKEPTPGDIVERSRIEELDVEVWTLSNGIRVLAKPTEFKQDQILFGAFSPGGHSLAPDSLFIPASSADAAVSSGGLGNFSLVQLDKKLSGKIAQVSPFIAELQEGLSGSCSPEDLETMMRLIYLRFTAPRADADAFESYMARTRAALENRLAQPEGAFRDRIQRVMGQNHLRRLPWTPETVDEMDLEASLKFYRERFADAGGFTFVFVGSFKVPDLENMVKKYLAGLPATGTEERWVDHGIRPPKGALKETIQKGHDQKSLVATIFSGPMKWSFRERHYLRSMLTALNIRLREVVREDLGGTYVISARPSMTQFPEPEYQIIVSFGCDPDQADTLVAAAMAEIKTLQTDLVDDLVLTKIKEGQRRARETDLERNPFWLDVLTSYAWNGEDPLILLAFDDSVDALTKEDIREAARRYFGTPNVAKFTLVPEPGEKE
jgi:zinc protease